jgi:hypothetical protein
METGEMSLFSMVGGALANVCSDGLEWVEREAPVVLEKL